ncbi:MAG: hypothetical protein KDB53_20325 [Planctomycetes bacterium]|nr:hypothetical protein [Planctomycetota bacterium]
MNVTKEWNGIDGDTSGDSEVENPYLDLLSPAWWPAGERMIDARRRIAIANAARRTGESLGGVLDLRVTLGVNRGKSASNHETWVFGLLVEHDGLEVVIGLDLAAARPIVDRLGELRAGLRGHGDLSAVESGLLEYATLRCVDTLAHHDAELPCTLLGFLGAAELSARAVEAVARPIRLQVKIGGHSGQARLWIPAEWTTGAFGDARFEEPCQMRLALPVGELEEADLDGLAAGDAILLGGHDLTSLQARLRVVTSTGWCLGAPEAVEDLAGHVELTLGSGPPRPILPEEGSTLRAEIGSLPLDERNLSGLQPGGKVALVKDLRAPVRLRGPQNREWTGELIRIEQAGLAIRVVTTKGASS